MTGKLKVFLDTNVLVSGMVFAGNEIMVSQPRQPNGIVSLTKLNL